MPKTLCPCGSQQALSHCCQPIHQNPALASHPEQLMRSRYSAHVLGLVDYVVATYHPSCHAEDHRDAIADSVNSHWFGLKVINSEIATSGEGFVEFEAYYQDGDEQYCWLNVLVFYKKVQMALPNGITLMANTQTTNTKLHQN